MISNAIQALKKGQPIILTDDEARENEGDLVFPAHCITREIMAMMIRYGSGIVCLCLPPEHVDRLGLPLMVPPAKNETRNGTAFTLSIEAKVGVSTGVSAHDRVQTILTAVHPQAKPTDLARPGHVFPLRAAAGGVFERPGHTEGSIELVQMAGFPPAAVICEIMNDDGTMARAEALEQFAKTHGLAKTSIAELIEEQKAQERHRAHA